MARLLVIVLTLLIGASAPASAGGRVALLIGNAAYQHVPSLRNPPNDVALVKETLVRAGFDVVDARTNLTRDEMVKALRAFEDRAADVDIAVIYYSGHGIEMGGDNFLVPIDASLPSDRDVPDQTISLDRIMTAVEGARRLRLVVLDACRNNPFVASIKRTKATRSIDRGLARIEPASADTLVAYAAKAGTTAVDGDGANSPFAAALARRLAEPDLDVQFALRKVRDDVLAATGRHQEPFFYGSLGGDPIAITPSKAVTAAPAAAPPATPPKQVAAVEPPTGPGAPVKGEPPEKAIVESPAQEEAGLQISPDTLVRAQAAFTALGYGKGVANGVISDDLRAALRRFQRYNNLEDSGYFTKQTLARLEEDVFTLPQNYDGLWQVEIHRYNYGADPGGLNQRTHLVSVKLRWSNGQASIVSSDFMNDDSRTALDSLKVGFAASGAFSLSMKTRYLYGKSRYGTADVKASLPRLVAYNAPIEIKGNRLESEIWFKLYLTRLKN